MTRMEKSQNLKKLANVFKFGCELFPEKKKHVILNFYCYFWIKNQFSLSTSYDLKQRIYRDSAPLKELSRQFVPKPIKIHQNLRGARGCECGSTTVFTFENYLHKGGRGKLKQTNGTRWRKNWGSAPKAMNQLNRAAAFQTSSFELQKLSSP